MNLREKVLAAFLGLASIGGAGCSTPDVRTHEEREAPIQEQNSDSTAFIADAHRQLSPGTPVPASSTQTAQGLFAAYNAKVAAGVNPGNVSDLAHELALMRRIQRELGATAVSVLGNTEVTNSQTPISATLTSTVDTHLRGVSAGNTRSQALADIAALAVDAREAIASDTLAVGTVPGAAPNTSQVAVRISGQEYRLTFETGVAGAEPTLQATPTASLVAAGAALPTGFESLVGRMVTHGASQGYVLPPTAQTYSTFQLRVGKQSQALQGLLAAEHVQTIVGDNVEFIYDSNKDAVFARVGQRVYELANGKTRAGQARDLVLEASNSARKTIAFEEVKNSGNFTALYALVRAQVVTGAEIQNSVEVCGYLNSPQGRSLRAALGITFMEENKTGSDKNKSAGLRPDGTPMYGVVNVADAFFAEAVSPQTTVELVAKAQASEDGSYVSSLEQLEARTTPLDATLLFAAGFVKHNRTGQVLRTMAQATDGLTETLYGQLQHVEVRARSYRGN